MAGLDKILEDIRRESQDAVDALMQKAKAGYDEAMAEAGRCAEEQTQKILSQAKAQAADLIARADSAAKLQRARAILEMKQQIIAETIGKAKDAIAQMPDDAYFDLLVKMIRKQALKQDGVIILNEKDRARLPKDFAEKIAAVLPEGSSLEISDVTAKIDGGVILKYDGIEQNLSLAELFEENRDQMTDIAGKLLFS